LPNPQISIVVPTLNEAENLPELAARLHAVLAGRTYELLIVDDNSRDNTRAVCAELARKYPLRLIVRENPKNGLSGAVLAGLAEAKGTSLVVMDADLQHPPEKVPDLLGVIESGRADFVIGSRYVPGASVEETWGLFRQVNSNVATLLARPFSGRVRDPMSGFFALPRSTYDRAERLTPLGYKIALELMSKCRVRHVEEVPIHFGLRGRGESKLNIKQQFRYLEHLSRLYDFSYPRLSPVGKFGIVLLLAWTLGALADWVLIEAGVGPLVAVAVAYLAAIGVTAVFHLRYVRTQREFLVRQTPWRDFLLVSLAEWAVCIASAAWVLHRVDRPGKVELFLIAFGCATVARYVTRKELLQDIRGLRKDLRKEELG
jgi:dolichol-phosphate mannosyltransferase